MEHHALVQEIIVLGLKNNTCVKRNGKARLKKRLRKSLDKQVSASIEGGMEISDVKEKLIFELQSKYTNKLDPNTNIPRTVQRLKEIVDTKSEDNLPTSTLIAQPQLSNSDSSESESSTAVMVDNSLEDLQKSSSMIMPQSDVTQNRVHVMKQEINNLRLKNNDLRDHTSMLRKKLDVSQKQSLMLLEDRRSLQKKNIEHSLETMKGIFNPRAMKLVENATLSDSFSKNDPLMLELTVPVVESSNIPQDMNSQFIWNGKQTHIFRCLLSTGHSI
ncbi:uncharacterized protein LOC135683023 isoform X1 [Rhopilema esculentum]|uniref:uncharacterized protein LOC135683023 isoform X1 n=1 Tax=Rhopilema esculentum TaxID=499914 RepID=UPI0031E41067